MARKIQTKRCRADFFFNYCEPFLQPLNETLHLLRRKVCFGWNSVCVHNLKSSDLFKTW